MWARDSGLIGGKSVIKDQEMNNNLTSHGQFSMNWNTASLGHMRPPPWRDVCAGESRHSQQWASSSPAPFPRPMQLAQPFTEEGAMPGPRKGQGVSRLREKNPFCLLGVLHPSRFTPCLPPLRRCSDLNPNSVTLKPEIRKQGA